MTSSSAYQRQHKIEIRYTSVWLVNNNDKILPNVFYCPKCRAPVIQYIGEMVTIVPGGSPSKVPIIVKCPNPKCGTKYYFNAIVNE